MDNLKDFLLPKRFSGYGYIVAILNVFAGAIFGVITSVRTTERRQFHCNSHDVIADKNFLTAKCYNQYEQHYNPLLPLHGFVLLTFAILAVVCIIYSWCCVKSRVDQVEEACTPNPEILRPSPVIRTRYIFCAYLIQLLIRFGFGAFFASLQLTGLYPSKFPSQFHCQWNSRRATNTANLNVSHSNSSSLILINCENSTAREKTVWALFVCILHIIFACLVLLEAFYLLARACHTKTFMRDSDFCQRHLFKRGSVSLVREDFIKLLRRQIVDQTEYLEPLIPSDPEENWNRTAIDDIYIDLIISSGRVTYDFDRPKNRHELLDVYMKAPQSSVRINIVDELFLSEGKSYHTLLVVGRPGIGKTSLCTKIIRDWCKSKALKQFKYVFTFRFRHLNTETVAKMKFQQFLNKAEHSSEKVDSTLLRNIAENPESVLIIFDGFDEYKHREKLMNDQLEFSGSNGLNDVIPVTALYANLLEKKLLSGATILTTTRPNAVDTLRTFHFDRVAEILGFTPEKIQSYVEKFCKDDTFTASRIWQHIERNVNLLYLCYIPVTCWIVCSLLKDCIKAQRDSGSLTFALPTTLTDVYKGALRLFLFKHSPDYQHQTSIEHYENDSFFDSIENALSKLGLLAAKGIEERRLVFEKKEVQGLENFGLLNCMPSKKYPLFGFVRPSQYCFIHLTLQEFLAARCIAKKPDPNEVAQFIESKVHDANWHLVIQFLTGLLEDQLAVQIAECLISIFCDSVIATKNNQILLLMLKCFYELSNEDVTIRAATTLTSDDKFNNCVNLSDIDLAPVDCTAIVYVLRYFGTGLHALDISYNRSFGAHGCLELTKVFNRREDNERNDKGALNQSDENCHLTQLNLEYNQITDQGVLHLSGALKSENCHLSQLNLRGNKITNQGVLHLSDALKSKNCHLTILDLQYNEITDQGVVHLSDALKSENCHLTQLDLVNNKITDQGVLHLSDALKSGNCHLTQLDLVNNKITNQGVLDLSDALKSENCHLTKLNLEYNQITDQGVLHLSDALKSENCPLTQLNLEYNEIGDQGVLDLSGALKSENCHLTQLNLGGNMITDQGVLDVSDALKDRKCHLIQLNLAGNKITDQGVLHLSNALKCENCRLTQLDLGHNHIADQGVEHLSDALKSKNCHLIQLVLNANKITHQGLLHLSDALKNGNCHLTQLDLISVKITGQDVSHLSCALMHENCHLTKLDLSNNSITDQTVSQLSDALKSERCHLTQLNLSYNQVTDQGVLHLSDALKCENCHLPQFDLISDVMAEQRERCACGGRQLRIEIFNRARPLP